MTRKSHSILAFLSILISIADAQTNRPDSTAGLQVYFDCNSCDMDYFRQNLKFFDYVRNRQDAQLHLLITTERSGGGGVTYEITTLGLGEFAGQTQTFRHSASVVDSDEEQRAKLLNVIKLGLMPYIAQTSMAQQVKIEFKERSDQDRLAEVIDPWKGWIVQLGGQLDLEGEASSTGYERGSDIRTNRTTDIWKVHIHYEDNFEQQKFELDDGTTYSSETIDRNLHGIVIYSLSEHWSIGGWTSLQRNSVENTSRKFDMRAAIEYNIFPYSESSRREFRIFYRAGLQDVVYQDTTIFNVTEERLFAQNIEAVFSRKETWGETSVELNWSSFFHDPSKNRLSVGGEIRLNLLRGLQVQVEARWDAIHDQLYLPKGDASIEDLLLQQREQATEFRYGFSVGLSYTFGSIYNNIVNSRFGD